MTDQKNKPRLDEQTFAKLLEAAHDLQNHNLEIRRIEESLELQSEQLRQQEAETQATLQQSSQRTADSQRPDNDYTLILSEIVETQHQIQIGQLESDEAMAVVARRIARITNASGAAIGILEGKAIRYHAGTGPPALPVGSEVPLENAFCAISVRTGQVLRTPDASKEFLFDAESCRKRKIRSLVAVPIYHDGAIVGALELYFDRVRGFAEEDIHTCQLMAGLVTEAIGRGAEWALKNSMAAERSAMLAAIEKLKPNLAALAKDQTPAIEVKHEPSRTMEAGTTEESSVCWKCGETFFEQELFCGKCGAARISESDPSSVQSKLASAWLRQQASHDAPPANGNTPPRGTVHSHTAEDEEQLIKLLATAAFPDNLALAAESGASEETNEVANLENANESDGAIQLLAPASQDIEDDLLVASDTATRTKQRDVTWSSAAKARDFLEAITEKSSSSKLARFWRARRGDFYLAIAVVLVFFVIRWGMLPHHTVRATGRAAVTAANRRKTPSPDADLSMFDKLMIGLGLAEAPDAPEYKGNPDTQVWIDPHTALYYCSDSDLYGKTSNGKFASQRDAQMDQFEPASRRACD
ncbi:MAG: GAF domain-containing protein [Candidatus Sulfotelmatobacter sp.]